MAGLRVAGTLGAHATAAPILLTTPWGVPAASVHLPREWTGTSLECNPMQAVSITLAEGSACKHHNGVWHQTAPSNSEPHIYGSASSCPSIKGVVLAIKYHVTGHVQTRVPSGDQHGHYRVCCSSKCSLQAANDGGGHGR